jgi:hypothetical protein
MADAQHGQRKHRAKRAGTLTGNCPIREHTGDGAYVGRCDFACYDGVCPRHGRLGDYPTHDDREVAVKDRIFAP